MSDPSTIGTATPCEQDTGTAATPERPDISRRALLGGVGATAASLAFGDSATSAAPAAGSPGQPVSPRRPNIVMVVADDLGYSDIGCFGSEINTPNLDALGTGGRRFTQMYTYPVCSPTRASIMTGLYPTQAGMGDLAQRGIQGIPAYQGYLPDTCATLGQVLGAAGYRTSISGKWHLARWSRTDSLPHTRGFERAFSPMGGNYYRPNRYLDGDVIGVPDDPDFYTTTAITDHAVESIEEFATGSEPFFSYVSYFAPHFPLHAWEADIAPYRGTYQHGWEELRRERFARQRDLGVVAPDAELPERDPLDPDWDSDEHHDWQDARMAAYAGQVSAMDRGIGRIMRALEDLNLVDDTLVIFCGDNGASSQRLIPGRNSHQRTIDGSPMQDGNIPGLNPGPSTTWQSYGRGWATASDTPFRKWKSWVHEGGIATPCVASWPARLSGGEIDHRPLHVIDLMPTLLDLAGVDYPAEFDGHQLTPLEGVSFAKVLADAPGAPEWSRGRDMFWEYRGNRAVRQGRWKLVSEHPGAWELYDMHTDRSETTDLASERPDKVADLAARWESWKDRVGVRDWDPDNGYRP